MRVSCPNCSKPYLVPDAKIPAQGARIRCKQCTERFVVKPFPADFAARDFRDLGVVWTLKRADGPSLEFTTYGEFETFKEEGLLTPNDTLTFDHEAFPTLKQLADVQSWMWEIWRRVEEHRIQVPERSSEEEETGDAPTFSGLFRGDREQAFSSVSHDAEPHAEGAAAFEEATLPSEASGPSASSATPLPPPVHIEGPTNTSLAPPPVPEAKRAPRVAPVMTPTSNAANDPLGLLSTLGRPSQKGTPRVRPSSASRPQSSTPTPSSASTPRQPPPVAGIRNPGMSLGLGSSRAPAEPLFDADPKTEEAIFELPPMPENAQSAGISPFHLFGGLVAALAVVLFPFTFLILGFFG